MAFHIPFRTDIQHAIHSRGTRTNEELSSFTEAHPSSRKVRSMSARIKTRAMSYRFELISISSAM